MNFTSIGRVALFLFLSLILGSCDTKGGSIVTEIPSGLKQPLSTESLLLNSEATNGCAFAGTWEYENPVHIETAFDSSDGTSYGTILIEVIPMEGSAGSDIGMVRGVHNYRIVYPWLGGERTNSGTGYFSARTTDQGRSISTVMQTLMIDNRLHSDRWDLQLSDDGLKLNPIEAKKIRAGVCGEVVPFIDGVKAALEKESGQELPPYWPQ